MKIDDKRDPSDEQKRMMEAAENQAIAAELKRVWRMVADVERRLQRLEQHYGIRRGDQNA